MGLLISHYESLPTWLLGGMLGKFDSYCASNKSELMYADSAQLKG